MVCGGHAVDRLIQEITPLGSISYEYDVLGRRTKMQIAGQAEVLYSYDADSRLASISTSDTTHGVLNFDLGYDALGRRASLTYPNGLTTSYTYDDASSLLTLKHLNSLNIEVESLNYLYNANGDRSRMDRANVLPGLPNPVASNTYNEASQMMSHDADAMTYDENGNMTSVTNSCGTTTYTWDARNRLSGINGFNSDCSPLTASFKYDALGRRIEKTVNGKAVQYLYDGSDIVQEIENGIVSANYVRTLNIDEPLTRIRSDGMIRYYQQDALGSAIVLTDESGNVKTTYSYDPFGNVTISGEASDNAFQFAGRENDGTGLLYERNRYYSYELHRYISEDPIGFEGGDVNYYVRVGNNPVNFVDPLGLDGIYVGYQGYPVNTGYGFTLPLGHGAVIAVDPKTGTTKYFEYGRYDSNFGQVKSRVVPDLVMKNDKPTAESLANLYKYISGHYGKNSPVDATYYPDADYQKIIDFALKRMRDKNRDPYSIWNNNCKTFGRDAIDAGRN